MLSDKILYQLILRQLDTKASDALITYSDAYAYALREDSAISSPTPGERKWNAAVVALIEAERAHLQEILLRHDRRTMEIGSVVLFLRGFERLLELVGPLPKKEVQITPKVTGKFEWTLLPTGVWRATSTVPVNLGKGDPKVVYVYYYPLFPTFRFVASTADGDHCFSDVVGIPFDTGRPYRAFQELRGFLFDRTGLVLDLYPIYESSDAPAWEQKIGTDDISDIWELLWGQYVIITKEYSDNLSVLVYKDEGPHEGLTRRLITQRLIRRDVSHDEIRRLFDEVRMWLLTHVGAGRAFIPHPKYERPQVLR